VLLLLLLVVELGPAALPLLPLPLPEASSKISAGTSHRWSMLLMPSLLLPQDSLIMAAYLSRPDRGCSSSPVPSRS
jgi:hypothetical protein